MWESASCACLLLLLCLWSQTERRPEEGTVFHRGGGARQKPRDAAKRCVRPVDRLLALLQVWLTFLRAVSCLCWNHVAGGNKGANRGQVNCALFAAT